MNVLVIGDVTSPGGIEYLKKTLWRARREHCADLCIVNGENAAFITGISPALAEELLSSGADVITGGNHTLRNRSAYAYLDEKKEILRPINFGGAVPGRGYTIVDAAGYRALVINAMGTVNINPTLDSPFRYIEDVLRDEAGKYDFAVLDIHAEATGEKLAIAHAFDGRINVIFGTHTHVPTADEQILPHGTGYISDVGMCGESGGILGMDTDVVIERIRSRLPHSFKAARGPVVANGALFKLDVSTGAVLDVKRISF